MRSALGNLLILAVTTIVMLVAVESGLRLRGFSFHLYPEDIEFGRPDQELMRIGFEPDDDLFWVTPGYREKLDRLGTERPELVLLGDSCTHLGHYDRELAALAAERRGSPLSVGNLGVAGWSSFQGRRQLERDVVALKPRVATFYFGWNDHWIGFGIEDKNVANVRRVFASRWSHLRVVQLMAKASVALAAREEKGYPNRVDVEDFRQNLQSMVTTAREAGIVPMLLTAPSSHRRGAEPAELAERWLRDLDELIPLHESYVEVVREVARQQGALLCDLAARFAELDPASLEASFREDGIHLTVLGDRRLAEYLLTCLDSNQLL